MAKIDTSTINGYAGMTPEQKISYFENYDFNDNASELAKAHESIKKLTGENAEWKRKWNEKASDDEKKAESDKSFKEEYDKQLAKLAEYEQKDKLLKSGFSAEEVEKIIAGNGEPTVYAEIYKAREEKLKKSLSLGNIKNGTPKSGVGNESGDDDDTDFITKLAKEKFAADKGLQSIKDRYKK